MIRVAFFFALLAVPNALHAQNLVSGTDVNRFVEILQTHTGIEMATECSDATEEAATDRALCVAYLESMTTLALGADATHSRDLDYIRVKYWQPSDADAWLGLVLTAAEIVEPTATTADDELVTWLSTARSNGEAATATFGQIEITYEDDFGDHIAHIRRIGDTTEY